MQDYGKTGLVTGLLGGKQGWKCPVVLLGTCCGSKSLKDILIDSDFGAYPVLDALVVYYESIKRDLKTKLIYECRCDERQKTKVEESTRLACTALHDKTN